MCDQHIDVRTGLGTLSDKDRVDSKREARRDSTSSIASNDLRRSLGINGLDLLEKNGLNTHLFMWKTSSTRDSTTRLTSISCISSRGIFSSNSLRYFKPNCWVLFNSWFRLGWTRKASIEVIFSSLTSLLAWAGLINGEWTTDGWHVDNEHCHPTSLTQLPWFSSFHWSMLLFHHLDYFLIFLSFLLTNIVQSCPESSFRFLPVSIEQTNRWSASNIASHRSPHQSFDVSDRLYFVIELRNWTGCLAIGVRFVNHPSHILLIIG